LDPGTLEPSNPSSSALPSNPHTPNPTDASRSPSRLELLIGPLPALIRPVYTPPSPKALRLIADASYNDLTTRSTWETPIIRGQPFDLDPNKREDLVRGFDNPDKIKKVVINVIGSGLAILSIPPFSRGWHRGWPTPSDEARQAEVEYLVDATERLRASLNLNPAELTTAVALTAMMAYITNRPDMLARIHQRIASICHASATTESRLESPPRPPPRPPLSCAPP